MMQTKNPQATNPQATITKCRITECGGRFGHDHKIMATFTDNPEQEEAIYTFYCDEKSYVAASFVGLTRESATARVLNDDVKYLQSPAKPMAF
jgi:hypothetical protein